MNLFLFFFFSSYPKMSSQQNNTPIDNDLFRLYSQYTLCKIERSSDFTESEKAAIMAILKNTTFVDGSKLCICHLGGTVAHCIL